MKRLHVHVRVEDLKKSIAFYSAMFDAPPTVAKDDYAKWMLDDPRVNFAITPARGTVGVDHLGVQVETAEELAEMHQRLESAETETNTVEQMNASCCYARSDKYWSQDPQGVAWETFHSLDSIPVFGGDLQPAKEQQSACCAVEPVAADIEAKGKQQCC